MKILGIGIDLVQNSRIKKYMAQSSAERLLTKILHPTQISYFQSLELQSKRIEYVGSRWAAKQAVAKAIGKLQLEFSQMRVFKDANGKPYIQFEGEGNCQILNQSKVKRCHISFTHQVGYTVAHAIVEKSINDDDGNQDFSQEFIKKDKII